MVIEASGLGYVYVVPGGARVPALREVSLRVAEGEFVSIVGRSGSGKSTLLYCLSGLLPVTTGRVRLLGQELNGLSQARLSRLHQGRVGFVFQELNLIPSLTAVENVTIQRRFARLSVREAEAVAVLDAMALGPRTHTVVSRLSGGEQQRVAVARCLYSRPAVVFADEPTGALDSANSQFVLGKLRELADSGICVVMVTHDLAGAATADRVIVLRDGSVQAEMMRPSADDLYAAMRAGDAR